MRALRKLVARMDIVAVATALIQPVFNEVEQWAPRMDFADACAVVLARNYERAFVLTTDFRDFSVYRVPFASPEGAFHVWNHRAVRISDGRSARAKRPRERETYPSATSAISSGAGSARRVGP